MAGVLGRISRVRHAVVGAAIGGTTLLAGTGVIGEGDRPERFETWHVVIAPTGADGLRLTETFDQDFGNERRRGHLGRIPNDLGAPIDVVASSPDAPDDLRVTDLGLETEIRIGDPDVTITGQHRYRLAYTLPAAQLGSGVLTLDVLDPEPIETDYVEIVVVGFELDDPRCFVGAFDSIDECVLAADGDLHRAVFEPLPAGAGITIEADIVAVTDPEAIDPAAIEPPPIPERRSSNRGLTALGVGGVGLAGAFGVHRWARRRGRNEVFAGGAADAAYGSLPPPGGDGAGEPPPPVALVADDDLGDLATIEFVPPKGLEPWEASVLLTERIGDDTVEAWLSGLAGRDAVEFDEQGDDLVIRSGPERRELDEVDAALLDQIFAIESPFVTGTYDEQFAKVWRAISARQKQRIATSGWWKRLPPGSGIAGGSGGAPVRLLLFICFGLFVWGSGATALFGAFGSWPLALAFGLAVPAAVAYFMYRALLPVRSAQGSALALRAESFRRFLHASEGRHVEWAWSQGVLREYSGWAVALGEADAWSDALDGANVPAPARAAAGPIIVHRRAPSMRSTRTAPGSSGGGGRSGGFGGGGSRGGRVGGGGGGRSRGSW